MGSLMAHSRLRKDMTLNIQPLNLTRNETSCVAVLSLLQIYSSCVYLCARISQNVWISP